MGNRVIIAGSRTIPENSNVLFNKVSRILQNIKYSEIVSGGARGADKFGEWFAKSCSTPLKIFEADWDTFGKSAGYIRNKEMADYATHLIAILDMSVPSKGTRHMIKIAQDKGLEIRVIEVTNIKNVI